MSSEVNWLNRLEKSENKSRSITSGKSLRLSSIDGWTRDKLPKLLIVWNFQKQSSDAFPSITRPGKFSKKRDIMATVNSYELFLITEEENSVVPWEYEISHRDLVKIYWTDEWIERLKKIGSELNSKYSERPINFQLSFKNGKYLRLQYQIKDYTKLPKCPKQVSSILRPHLDSLIGVQFRLKKDHSSDGGVMGWYDNDMAKWENQNNLKKSGILYVKKPNNDWEEYRSFSEGKQDYWSGFAIDFLISQELPNFVDRGGHETGVDHTLDFTSNQTKLVHATKKKKKKKNVKVKKAFKKVKKFFGLR